MNDLHNTLQDVGNYICRTAPKWMTALGIGMFGCSMVLSGRAALRADTKKKMEEAIKKRALTRKETIKSTWTSYIPPVACAVAGAAMVLGSDSISNNRGAALMTAYTMSEATLRAYKDKMEEVVGPKKMAEVQEEVQNRVANTRSIQPPSQVVHINGGVACVDLLSKRAFMSTKNKIDAAVNEINRRLRDEMYISLNEYYDLTDLERIPMADDLGWNVEKGYVEVDYTSDILEDGTPCLVVGLNAIPDYKFQYF